MCNFDLKDLASPDTGKVLIDTKLVITINSLVQELQIYDDSLTITSGYRTREHNKKVGGAARSYHIQGMAIDCYSPNYSHENLARVALQNGFTTAIVYKTHVHLDIREKGLGLRRSNG